VLRHSRTDSEDRQVFRPGCKPNRRAQQATQMRFHIIPRPYAPDTSCRKATHSRISLLLHVTMLLPMVTRLPLINGNLQRTSSLSL